jgi:methyl-accepting chemotaxis protein
MDGDNNLEWAMRWLSGPLRVTRELAQARAELAEVKSRVAVLDTYAGVGLWEAVLHNADAMAPESRWTWSAEFRRLVGFKSTAEFPNVVQSWSDRLHPEDVASTFDKFGAHLADKTGQTPYSVAYRLKCADGTYRWFRATGGCARNAQGTPLRACGSLTDIHDQVNAQENRERETADDQHAIAALTRGFAALADGNFYYRINETFSSKASKLRDEFNQTATRLYKIIATIVGAASELQSGTDEISRAANDLSHRTEQQAASLEETAAALDQITAAVRSTANASNHAQAVISSTKADAEQSGQVVRDAVAAMGEIEKSSTQISQIIGLIDEIAFQTNLLALNAGVEAARAGDAGRGFAVVASEVRALAQRSGEAAKEIRSLIAASTGHVGRGVKLVGDAGLCLGRIVSQVGEAHSAIVGIAASAEEQSTGLQEINSAVNQMDQMTQQNAAMVEQSTAASNSLAQETASLMRLTSRFDDRRRTAPDRTPQDRFARNMEPSPRPAEMTPCPKRVAFKVVDRRGAALAPDPRADRSGWKEY